MKDLREQTYYELLEVGPNASQEEILKAYNKVRTTYASNNPALYSLMSKEETEELLKMIDEAYAVLSNQFRKKQYDTTGNASAQPLSPVAAREKETTPTYNGDLAIPRIKDTLQETSHDPAFGTTKFGRYNINPEFEEEINRSDAFSGQFIQRIRMYKNISLDQISEVTKISRPYLVALENDDYASLPAPVFIRGFVAQICKLLDLDGNRIASSYMKVMKDSLKK